ncbi:hypothetical protein [Streptomyces pseudoechinosporeus]
MQSPQALPRDEPYQTWRRSGIAHIAPIDAPEEPPRSHEGDPNLT